MTTLQAKPKRTALQGELLYFEMWSMLVSNLKIMRSDIKLNDPSRTCRNMAWLLMQSNKIEFDVTNPCSWALTTLAPLKEDDEIVRWPWQTKLSSLVILSSAWKREPHIDNRGDPGNPQKSNKIEICERPDLLSELNLSWPLVI